MAGTDASNPTGEMPAPILGGVGAGVAAAWWGNGGNVPALLAGAALGMAAALLVGRLTAFATVGRIGWRTMWTTAGGTFGLLIWEMQTPLADWPAFNWTGLLVWVFLLAGLGRLFGPTPRHR